MSGFSGTGVPKDEGQHLQDVYRPAEAFGGPGFFGFDCDSHLDESSELADKKSARRLFTQWSEYWDLTKPVLVEKSPPNLVRTRFLQSLFPKVRFIVMIRHPIAVSYATRKWTNLVRYLACKVDSSFSNPNILQRILSKVIFLREPICMLLSHWLVCHEKLIGDIKNVENIMVLKYERLTNNPSSTLQEVWDFIGLKSSETQREIKSKVNERYFKKWKKMVDWSIGKRYYKYIISKYEKRVNNFGYSLKV